MLAVSTPATDYALLTAAELRAAAGVSDGSRDTELIALEKRVRGAISRACKVAADGAVPPTLRQETLTETLRPRFCYELLRLSRRPIVSVSSITEDGTSLAATKYEIEKGAGILRRLEEDEPASWAAAKIVVVYVAGWDTVPDDLKLAASKLATILWNETAKDPSLRSIEIPGVESREYWVGPADDPLIPAEIMQLLEAGGYVNYWVG